MKRLITIFALLAISIFAPVAFAATLAPLPQVKAQFFNATGTLPLVSGVVYFCDAGSTCPGTPKNTYTDYTGVTANANPVVLDSAGRANIWLDGFYKVVVKTAVGGTTISTSDYVSAAPQQTSLTITEWQVVNVTPTYLSATTFSVPDSYISTFTAGRRIKTTNTGGTIYSTISSSSYALGVTTVTVSNDTGVLDAGLSAVSVGLITITNSSIPVAQTLSKTANYTITGADHGKTIISSSTATTVTFTIATPAVATVSNHGYAATQVLGFTSTASLPAPLTASTQYYVIVDGLTASNFEVASSAGGTAINTDGTQSGNHTSYKQITFTLPAATAVPNGFYVNIKNDNAMPLTISGTVDGSTTLKLIQYDEIRLSSNGTTWSGNKAYFRPGTIINISTTYFTNLATGATAMVADDSIPAITEGDQYMSMNYTPKSTTSILMIEGLGNFGSNNGAARIIAALFNSTASGAVATMAKHNASTDDIHQFKLDYEVATGNTQPVVLTVRAGGPAGPTISFNGYNGATRLFGGTIRSYIRVTEIAQ